MDPRATVGLAAALAAEGHAIGPDLLERALARLEAAGGACPRVAAAERVAVRAASAGGPTVLRHEHKTGPSGLDILRRKA